MREPTQNYERRSTGPDSLISDGPRTAQPMLESLLDRAREQQDKLAEAIAQFQLAIDIAGRLENVRLGQTAAGVDLYRAAIELYESIYRDSETADEIESSYLEARAFFALGGAHRGDNDIGGAVQSYGKAEVALGPFGDPDMRWQIARGRGLANRARGDLDGAEREYQDFLDDLLRSEPAWVDADGVEHLQCRRQAPGTILPSSGVGSLGRAPSRLDGRGPGRPGPHSLSTVPATSLSRTPAENPP